MFLFSILTVVAILVMSFIHFILVSYIAQITRGYKDKINYIYEKMNKIKIVISLFVFILSWYGMYQVVQYYLFSGPIFWYVIFSVGIILAIYIAPLSACSVSFLNMNKSKWAKFESFHWNLVGFTLWGWGVILLLDRSTVIYLDEGGVNTRYGNGTLKFLGGIGLIVAAVYVSFMIVVKYVNEKNIEKELKKTEIKSERDIVIPSNKKVQWKSLLLMSKSIIITFLPVIIFILLKIIYSILFFDQINSYIWAFDGNILILLTIMSILLYFISLILLKNKFFNMIELFFILFLSIIWVMIFWNIYNPILVLGTWLFGLDQWYATQLTVTLIAQLTSLMWLFYKIKQNKGIGIKLIKK